MTRSIAARALTAALLAFAGSAMPLAAADLNDYPTSARADYVFACMKTNGETRHALDQCSCSIDIIASILPYERYVAAETVMSMAQVPGERASVFRTPEPARAALNDLRQAQAEAEVRCF
jgi:lysyl-tRNA synthetase class II